MHRLRDLSVHWLIHLLIHWVTELMDTLMNWLIDWFTGGGCASSVSFAMLGEATADG